MDYSSAQIRHKEQWLLGRKGDMEDEYVFPYNNNFESQEFIEAIIPIEHCVLQDTDTDLVRKYHTMLQEGHDLGPSWVAYGKVLRDGMIVPFWHKKFYVLDGNHRIQAKKNMQQTTSVIVPKTCYELYVRNQHGSK